MPTQKSDLIIQNEKEVNTIVTKILAFSLISIPFTLLCNIIGLFILTNQQMLILSISIFVISLTPLLFKKIGTNDKYLKYIIVTSLIILGILFYIILQLNVIFMVVLCIAVALMYFDVKLMKYTLFLNCTLFILSDYIACLSNTTILYSTEWWPLHAGAFIFQFAILIPIFLAAARRSSKLLINMSESMNNINTMLEVSNLASKNLSEKVNDLLISASENNHSFTAIGDNIENMASAANTTVEDIKKSFDIFDNIKLEINDMNCNISDTVKISQNIENISNTNKVEIQSCVEETENLKVEINKSKIKVEKLEERSKQIGRAVEMITSIATETNLLSLNASIEAARAGESGKGFAVVASEVRKLAEQSALSAGHIQEIIETVSSDVNEVVSAIDENYISISKNANSINNAKESFDQLLTIEGEISNNLKSISGRVLMLVKISDDAKILFQQMMNSTYANSDKITDVSATIEKLIETNESIVKYIENVNSEAKKLTTMA